MECSICHTEYTEDSSIVVTKCNHYFHLECLVKWFHVNNTCPFCRYEFEEIEQPERFLLVIENYGIDRFRALESDYKRQLNKVHIIYCLIIYVLYGLFYIAHVYKF